MTGHDWPWLTMTDHDWPWLTMTDHDWPWLNITGHDWPRLAITDHDWPRLTMTDHGWPWLTINNHDWPWLNITGHDWAWLTTTDHDWPRLTMTDHDWPWLTITGHDWPWLTMTDHDWPLLTITDHDWPWSTDYDWPSHTMIDHGWSSLPWPWLAMTDHVIFVWLHLRRNMLKSKIDRKKTFTQTSPDDAWWFTKESSLDCTRAEWSMRARMSLGGVVDAILCPPRRLYYRCCWLMSGQQSPTLLPQLSSYHCIYALYSMWFWLHLCYPTALPLLPQLLLQLLPL